MAVGGSGARAALPLFQSYQPRAFRERGVAAPFTTPMLAGARMRCALTTEVTTTERVMGRSNGRPGGGDAGQCGPSLEILVPNPSGTRGVYIMPWADIGQLCCPTMHDVRFGQALYGRLNIARGGARAMGPMLVRQVSRDVALQGVAGRAAARAAHAILDHEAHVRVATRSTLLNALIVACEPADSGWPPPQLTDHDDRERRGYLALTTLGHRDQAPIESILDRLEFVTDCCVDIGVGDAAQAASMPVLLTELGQLREEMSAWLLDAGRVARPGQRADPATTLIVAIERVMALAGAQLAAVRALLRDVAVLMLRARTDPDELAALCARPGWVTDGWERILRLWQTAPTPRERAIALAEMASLIPQIPEELEIWLSLPVGASIQLNQRAPQGVRAVPVEFSLVDRIARNEQILALGG